MLLPFHFIQFFFVNSLITFARIWHNTIMVLEEDLAVGLMLKLLLVPLFHDSSIVGRVMSMMFRITRIIYGLFAFAAVTVFFLFLAILWYTSPVLVVVALSPELPILNQVEPLFAGMVIFTIALFIHHISAHPLRKVWQVKSPPEVWLATKLKKEQITWDKLLVTEEVKSLLSSLEFGVNSFSSQEIPLSNEVIQKALDLAKDTGAMHLTPAYFWVAMLTQIPGVDNDLMKQNLALKDFFGALDYLEHKRISWRKVFIWEEDFGVKHLKGTNRGWLGAPTPALDQASVDLTRQASREGFDEFVGRQAVVSEVVTILSQEKDRNVLLVGPAGAGKTALVNNIARQIILGDAPPSLATKRLIKLETSRLLSGAKTEGDLAEKVKNIFEEVEFYGDTIIFIDEIHELGMGEAASNYNLYSLLEPYLENNRFQFIGATEQDNYARIMEKNTSFARIFHKVEVPPADIDDTNKIVFERCVELARRDKIIVTYLAIKTLVTDCAKLIHDRVLPDSALSVLEESKVDAENGVITSEIVKKVFEKRVNIPVIDLNQDQKQLLLNLEDIIHEQMIDQEQAVTVVSKTLRRASVSLREQNRPIGSFLFVGPTGVGKTELAKILARTYFKNSGAFVRFDMSEYQTDESVNRLLGTLSEPGELTEAVKNKPYALLLLDEFEKADPKILTLFLQVLDDGRLTDAKGMTVDFTNTIIIATSNAASVTIAQELEKGTAFEDVEKMVHDELLKVYKPELINRFDAVVVFKPLSEPDIEKIVHLKLADLQKMLKEQGYLIEFEPDLVTFLSQKGFDPILGARPLRRIMQDTLEAKLSQMILLNELKKGELLKAGIDFLQV